MRRPILFFKTRDAIEKETGGPKKGIGPFSLAVVILSALHWVILYFHIPVFTWIVWWFWKFTETPLRAFWLAPVLAGITFLCVRWVLGSLNGKVTAVFVLVVFGTLLQLGFGYMEGRGIEGIRYRMVTAGHSAFARYAVRQDSFFGTVKNYEEILDELERDGLGTYGRSKPPGTLLLYMATEHLANISENGASREMRLRNLQTLASYLWPFLSYLVLFPLYLFTSRTLDARTGVLACVLYVLVPSITLMPLHTDQTFFPFFAMAALYVFTLAVEKQSPVLGVASGIWFYLILFTTFSLLFILPLLLLVSLGVNHDGVWSARIRNTLKITAFFITGFLACDLIFRETFGYDILARFKGAMQNHVGWKSWAFDFFHLIHSGAINLVEFALWIGLPLTLLACYGVYRTLKTFDPEKADSVTMLTLGLILVVTALNIFGETKGETARLWLFLVPFVCTVASRSLNHLQRIEGRVLPTLVFISQWVTILLTKMNQDFY